MKAARVVLVTIVAGMIATVAGMIATLSGCSSGGVATTQAPTVTAVALTPQNSSVTVGKNLSFSATATYSDGTQGDVTSTATWSSSDTTIATVSAGTATGVAKGAVTIKVISGTKDATTLLNVTDQNLSNGTLQNRYAFFLKGIDSVGPTYGAGSFTADGNGNITGVIDANTSASGLLASNAALSGTYSITPDGRGEMTLTASGFGSGVVFRFVVSADGTKGKMIEYDGLKSTVGEFLQSTASGTPSGSYVFGVGGMQLDNPQNYVGEIGLMTASGTTLTGEADENFNGKNYPQNVLAGTLTAADSNNRGTLTLTLADSSTAHFVYYLASASQFYLVSVDPGAAGVDMIGGVAYKQNLGDATTLASGDYTFLLEHGVTSEASNFDKIGELAFSAGNVTGGTAVEDWTGSNAEDATYSVNSSGGTYTAFDAYGRGILHYTLGASSSPRSYIIYGVNSNTAYMLETSANNASGSAGRGSLGKLESSNSAATLPVAGDFIFSQYELGENNVLQVGQVSSDGNGNLTGICDFVAFAGEAKPVPSAAIASPSLGWAMTKVAQYAFEYSVSPQSMYIETDFFFVRPDGQRLAIVGYNPDTDGYMDLQ